MKYVFKVIAFIIVVLVVLFFYIIINITIILWDLSSKRYISPQRIYNALEDFFGSFGDGIGPG